MQIRDKIGGFLYDRGGKPGSNYPDLEPGKEFPLLGTQFRLQITIADKQSCGLSTAIRCVRADIYTDRLNLV